MKILAGDLVRRDYHGDRPTFVYGIALNDADRDADDAYLVVKWLPYYGTETETFEVGADQVYFVARPEGLSKQAISALVEQVYAARRRAQKADRAVRQADRALRKARMQAQAERDTLNGLSELVSSKLWPGRVDADLFPKVKS